MKYVLAIDVAKNKSMVSLINNCGEVLIEPYEVNHKLNDFKDLKERIEKNNIFYDDLTVFMESTSTYHLSIKRFFKENTLYKICVINPLHSAMHKRNLRKTKTDKQDCYNQESIHKIQPLCHYNMPSWSCSYSLSAYNC